MFDLRQFQREHAEWEHRNFGEQPAHRLLMGMFEEMGELTHALLKQEQGIRSGENLRAAEQDAIGDLVVFLAGYCTARGFDLEDVIAEVWGRVKMRDWRASPDAAHKIADALVQPTSGAATETEGEALHDRVEKS